MAHASNKAYLKKRKRFKETHKEGRKAYSNARKGRHRHEALLKAKGKIT